MAGLQIGRSWERDYEEHRGILQELERRDEEGAVVAQMRTHLEGPSKLLTGWDSG